MNLNLTLPTCYQELTPKQLRYVYFLISEGYDPVTIKTYCLFRWSGMEMIEPYGDGYTIRYQFNLHHITALQVAEQLTKLSWLDSLPYLPLRLSEINGHKAAAADLQGVTLQQFIYCDNLYQGYLHTQDTDLLQQMAQVLYDAESLQCSPEERISIFYWWASVKALFARKFSHYFTTSSTQDIIGDIGEKLRGQMDAMLRALTKGDITKEATVLQMDVWRALTELNAQAKEYDELRKEAHA